MNYIKSLNCFFLIQICLIKFSFSYLIFPFKTRKIQLNDNENNITLLFASLFDNNIFVEIGIGEPKQTIEFFLRSDIYNFYISKKPKNDNNSTNINPYIFDVGSNLNKFFDEKNSTSLVITNNSVISIYPEEEIGYVSNDFFHFTNTDNENISKRLPFILYNNTLRNTPGVIGLEVPLDEIDKEFSFIDILKENNVIDSYYWMINYTSDYEGNLIIGEQPHIFDPLYYKEEDLYNFYPFLDDAMYGWGLVFDEINFGEKFFRQFHETYFSYEINYIKGNMELENELDIYFNKSIQDGICLKVINKFSSYGPYRFFYCNKEKYKEKVKYFPKLEFYQFDYNYTFELDYEDLFIEKNDKLILLIFFDDAKFDWFFGKPFLKKYSFLMNPDTKILGFYKKEQNNKNEKSSEKNRNDIALKIIIVIIALIILLILGIFIGKYYFKESKKYKNVIDEEYDYTSKNDEIN